MHVQPVDPTQAKVVCPQCRTLQNVEVVEHDEETDMMTGQRCWYCGGQLDAALTREREFKVVLSGSDVPVETSAVGGWTRGLEHLYGSNLIAYSFDDAGRCIVSMHAKATSADDLDQPTE